MVSPNGWTCWTFVVINLRFFYSGFLLKGLIWGIGSCHKIHKYTPEFTNDFSGAQNDGLEKVTPTLNMAIFGIYSLNSWDVAMKFMYTLGATKAHWF